MSRDTASVTVVGRAGTHPQLSVGMTGDRVTFRVVATERRLDRATDQWVDGDEFGVTVVCWKSMATAALHWVRKGDPVVVIGRIVTRRFEKNGATQYFTELKADFVGFDVARADTRFTRKPVDQRPPADPAALSAEAGGDGPDPAADRRDLDLRVPGPEGPDVAGIDGIDGVGDHDGDHDHDHDDDAKAGRRAAVVSVG